MHAKITNVSFPPLILSRIFPPPPPPDVLSVQTRQLWVVTHAKTHTGPAHIMYAYGQVHV